MLAYILRKGFMKCVIQDHDEQGRVRKVSYTHRFTPDYRRHIEYDEDGNKIKQWRTKHGHMDGDCLEYYTKKDGSGRIKSAVSYKYDQKHGFSEEYYANGHLKSQVLYVFDKRSGHRKQYHSNGQLHLDCCYKADMPHGVSLEYDREGNCVQERMFYNGALHGISIIYGDNGRKVAIEEYMHGEQVMVITFDANGNQNSHLRRSKEEYKREGEEVLNTPIPYGIMNALFQRELRD